MRVARHLVGVLGACGLGTFAACQLAFPTDHFLATDAGSDAAPGDSGSYADVFSCDARVPQPLFCDDFDHGFPKSWTLNVQPGGEARTDDATFQSPPASALFRMAGNPANGCGYANIIRKFPLVQATHARAEFELRLTANDAGEYPSSDPVFALTLRMGSTSCNFLLQTLQTKTRTYIQEQFALPDGGGMSWQHSVDVAIPADKWNHVVVDADVDAGTITLLVGAERYLDQRKLSPECTGVVGSPEVAPGVYCQNVESPAVELRVDNFVFDAK